MHPPLNTKHYLCAAKMKVVNGSYQYLEGTVYKLLLKIQ